MILIIAYGNSLREDDGAGLVLAERLEAVLRHAAKEVRYIETQQLTPELAAEIAADHVEAVVFSDTRVMSANGDGVEVIPLTSGDPSSPSLGHHLDPTAVLAYASALSGRAQSPAWLVTVPGWQFGFGEELSARSQEAIDQAYDDPASPFNRLVSRLRQKSRHNGVPRP